MKNRPNYHYDIPLNLSSKKHFYYFHIILIVASFVGFICWTYVAIAAFEYATVGTYLKLPYIFLAIIPIFMKILWNFACSSYKNHLSPRIEESVVYTQEMLGWQKKMGNFFFLFLCVISGLYCANYYSLMNLSWTISFSPFSLASNAENNTWTIILLFWGIQSLQSFMFGMLPLKYSFEYESLAEIGNPLFKDWHLIKAEQRR